MSATSILVVEDDATLSDALQDTLELAGYNVITAENGKAALSCLDKQEISLIVSDINMPVMDGEDLLKQVKEHSPETPIMLMTAYGTIEQAVETMKEGAIDYLVKPFEAEVLVNMVSRYVKAAPASQADLVAVDDASQELVKLADRVAETDATVMITGESGAGKEVLAQYIHQHSARADKPFVAINCAAIPENMLEATLFGYEKGAYTGAYKASPGKFEQAQGGTILLDEI
ncbi:MAG: sigma-54 dependent transcriptional regulator, partial [Thioalkalispiraceae bacterium]